MNFEDWPRNDDGFLICSPEKPMPKEAWQMRWAHTNVEDIGECSSGCCDKKRCVDCGHSWVEEGPD